MGNTTKSLVKSVPLAIAFSHGFIYVETDKNVYYPGEKIEGVVHLLINKPLNPQSGTGV